MKMEIVVKGEKREYKMLAQGKRRLNDQTGVGEGLGRTRVL